MTAGVQVGANAVNAAVLSSSLLLTDNEVLGAEDPHTQRVLCGVRRAARLSEWLHAEGRADDSSISMLFTTATNDMDLVSLVYGSEHHHEWCLK